MRKIPVMATRNPRKNRSRSFSSEWIKKCASMAVKNGAMEIITPTLEA